jgi:hypothetical protein
MTPILRTLAGLLLAGALSAQTTAGEAPATQTVELLGLTGQIPAAWESRPPSSSMRLAQYRVPGAAGAADAELILYFFGQGQGGSAEANIARWQSQFSNPDGSPVTPRVEKLDAGGVPVTEVELRGSYARSVGMGQATAPRPDQVLLAAIVATERGNVYVQLHGASSTVDAARPAFDAFVRGLRRGSP